MTDKQIKTAAQRIKAQIHKHGTVHAFIDDTGAIHCVPGHSVELIAVYSEPVKQGYVEEDLQHAGGER